MTTDFYIIYAIITNSELLRLKILWYLWFLTKCLSNKYYITFNIFTNIGPYNILILFTFQYFNNIGSGYLRSEDGLRYLLLNLCAYSSPFHLTRLNPFDLSVDREGWWFEHSVSKLRVWLSAEGAKTFPGPSYVSSEDGVVYDIYW